MCDKMAISAYILKIVEKDPFLRLQMRAKEMFNRHHFFLNSELKYTYGFGRNIFLSNLDLLERQPEKKFDSPTFI